MAAFLINLTRPFQTELPFEMIQNHRHSQLCKAIMCNGENCYRPAELSGYCTIHYLAKEYQDKNDKKESNLREL